MRVLVLVICMLGSSSVFAANYPTGWPWHGLSVDNLSSQPSDIRRFKHELNIDVIRLQLKPVKLAKRKKIDMNQAWEETLSWLDAMLDMCKLLNVKAIVNLSHFPLDPSYKPNPNIKIAQYTPDFWGDKVKLQGVVQAVSRLTAHIKTRSSELAAIDIMSEPAVRDGKELVVPIQWRALIVQIIGAIRKQNRNVWIIVSPPPLGKSESYQGFEPIKGENILYGMHMYSPSSFAAQGIGRKKVGVKYPNYSRGEVSNKQSLRASLNDLRVFQKRYDVPVFVGEFSAVRWAKGGEQYIKDLTSIFNLYGWSWLYFSGTGWHGWNPDYNQNYPGKGGNWKADYVGGKSVRWQTLREIFGVNQEMVKP